MALLSTLGMAEESGIKTLTGDLSPALALDAFDFSVVSFHIGED